MIDALLLLSSDPVEHVAQKIWFWLGDGFWKFPVISNHMVMQIAGAALVCWLLPKAVLLRRGTDDVGRFVPRGLGNAIEAVCSLLRDQLFRPNLGKYSDLYTPYLWSLFFFILTCNLLGLIPLADIAGLFFGHNAAYVLGGNVFGNIWNTAALALLTLILIVGSGFYFHGMDYLKHFLMGPPGLNVFIAVLEIMGIFFKCLALCVRLFANMIAGHLVLAALLGFVGAAYAVAGWLGAVPIGVLVIAGSILFYMLEVMVAFLHAFIFTLLTAVFIGMAVNIEHHDESHEQGHGHDQAAPHGGGARPAAAH